MVDKQQTADADLENLRASLTESEGKAAAASAAATAAATENATLKTRLGDEVAKRVAADEATAASSLAAAESEASVAEAAIAAAGAASDWLALAKAQRALATAQTRIDAWSAQQTRIVNWKKSQVEASKKPAVETTRAATDEYTPATRAWLTKHPEIARDQNKMTRAVAAHFSAVADGMVPDSTEYFNYIEEKLGVGTKAADARREEPADDGSAEVALSEAAVVDDSKTKVKNQPTPKEPEEVEVAEDSDPGATATPPSRRTPAITAAGKASNGKVRLSAAEQEAARFSFPEMKPEIAYREYAKNKVKLETEGRLT